MINKWKNYNVSVFYPSTDKKDERVIEGPSFEIAVERYFGKIGIKNKSVVVHRL